MLVLIVLKICRSIYVDHDMIQNVHDVVYRRTKFILERGGLHLIDQKVRTRTV